MSYFIFKGVDSRAFGLLERIPMRPRANEGYETISIPGRMETISSPTGIWEDIPLPCTIGIKSKAAVREMYKWLTGPGELIFSDRPGEKYIVKRTVLSPEYLSVRFGKVNVEFTCSPFAYAVEPTVIDVGTAYTEVANNSSIYSAPLIEIKIKKDPAPILKGDVNFDGKIDARDASLVLSEYADTSAGLPPTFTPEQEEAADMNNDGLIDARDANAILAIYADGGVKDPSTPASNVIIYTNGAQLIVGIPDEVILNGFTVVVDCGLNLIYYLDAEDNMVNIMNYSSLDLPLLHDGMNYMKYEGDNVESVKVTINERWL